MARILVVDDSITVAKFTEKVLADAGHYITIAMDGDEAFIRLKELVFDLIILDVVMPKKNGFQICRELKTHTDYKHIPIVMMTTKSLDADRFWGMRQGADAYLIKPCPEADLIAAVNRLLKAEVSSPAPAANVTAAHTTFIIDDSPAEKVAETVHEYHSLQKRPEQPVAIKEEMLPLATGASDAKMEVPAGQTVAEEPAPDKPAAQQKPAQPKNRYQNPFYRF